MPSLPNCPLLCLLQDAYVAQAFLVEWLILNLLIVLGLVRMAFRAIYASCVAPRPGANIYSGAQHLHACLCCAYKQHWADLAYRMQPGCTAIMQITRCSEASTGACACGQYCS
jgi:hypothetical protein